MAHVPRPMEVISRSVCPSRRLITVVKDTTWVLSGAAGRSSLTSWVRDPIIAPAPVMGVARLKKLPRGGCMDSRVPEHNGKTIDNQTRRDLIKRGLKLSGAAYATPIILSIATPAFAQVSLGCAGASTCNGPLFLCGPGGACVC